MPVPHPRATRPAVQLRGRPRRAAHGACAALAALVALVLAAVPARAQNAARTSGAPADSARADTGSVLAVIPRPVRMVAERGRFEVTPRTVVWADAASAPTARQLARALEPALGAALAVRVGGAVPQGAIVLRRDAALARLGPEGYALDVRPNGVVARAPGAAGVFYAVQTLRQLLPPAADRAAPLPSGTPGTRWLVPAVSIEDAPRFAWRGAHLDVARHFMPKAFVERYIDLLARYKINTFHWHLTDDQGWRLEVKKYPRLTEVGAWRAQTLVGRPPRGDSTRWRYDGTPHGGYYTGDDVREVVAYARARFVNVVPEIEMPGHAVAAVAAYPELGVSGGPLQVSGRWGVFSDIFNARPATVGALQDVLGEVLALFPGRYVHVGGDEADKRQWKASAEVQARIRELGLKDEAGLQSWFIRQMDTYLTARGRRMVGWDEILEGGLAPGAVVMSWRGTAGGVEAARAGHDVVMTPTSHTYLDYRQSRDTLAEPVGPAYLPLDTVYAYEPVPPELTPTEARHVLGTQGQLWTEYMRGPREVEYMAFPRMLALAEVAWTPRARRDYADFRRRLTADLERLRALDVNFRPPGGPAWAAAAAGPTGSR